MANEHNDQFDSGEESEYHFSDEEVSYELEDEPSKSMASETESGEKEAGKEKRSFLSQMTQSRRMLIALGAFLGLIFVVYKMISPTSNAPTTDIAAVPATPKVVAAPSIPTPTTLPQNQTQPVTQVATQTPALPSPPPLPETTQQPITSTVTSSSPTLTVVSGPAPASLDQSTTQATASQPSPSMPQTTQNVTPTPTTVLPSTPSVPSVIQVQAQPAIVAQPQTTAVVTSGDASLDAKMAVLTASNERLIGQLQGQYSQQLNDFSNQNKALQDQVQSLTSRVSVMENQLNQLIQALTKRNQNSSMLNPTSAPPAQVQPQGPEVKVAYNVQAIIPGRAWLKSENGETLTVAEGDSIKDVGRVTKIDPYDGVVEINTGNRAISLSYGATG